MKTCFKCGETKPTDDFYCHPMMADGHLGKCKECTKRDVKRRNEEARPQRAAYERERFRRPERKAKVRQYAKAGQKRHPEKARARRAVMRALRTGKMARRPCEVCGTSERVQAHHDDYSRPLDVRWLCFQHHREHGHGQTVNQ